MIEGNVFTHLDSNAILLSGYSRGAQIRDNEFAWLGQSGVALWGKLEGETNRGLSGDQPRGTLLEGSLCREIGHLQKQSACFFLAIAAQTTLRRNVAYNLPRAAINFNDGFSGGNVVASNLLFNTCRESSDHGAFNSWDRLPYVTSLRDGTTPSTVPAFNDVHHNLIVANYGADGGCLDNDDGTSYYRIHANVCFYGGHKSDFDGHSKISSANLHIHPSVYGVKCVRELQGYRRQATPRATATTPACCLAASGGRPTSSSPTARANSATSRRTSRRSRRASRSATTPSTSRAATSRSSRAARTQSTPRPF